MRKRIEDLGEFFSAKKAFERGFTYTMFREAIKKGYVSPIRGLYIKPTSLEGIHENDALRQDHILLARAFRERFGGNYFFSHTTAAIIWGLPVPPVFNGNIYVTRFRPLEPFRSKGVSNGTVAPGSVTTTTHKGLPVATPAEVWVRLAPELKLVDAVALGDAMLHENRMPGTNRLVSPPMVEIEEFIETIEKPHRRNRRLLREIFALMTTKSASPPETHLRLTLAEWGFPPEQLDFDVYDEEGRLLGCSEIAFPSRRVVFEYEGDHHRTERRQWHRDIEKYNAYKFAGWEVVRVTSSLLYRDQAALFRITSSLLS